MYFRSVNEKYSNFKTDMKPKSLQGQSPGHSLVLVVGVVARLQAISIDPLQKVQPTVAVLPMQKWHKTCIPSDALVLQYETLPPNTLGRPKRETRSGN